jgi:hypothetical protein
MDEILEIFPEENPELAGMRGAFFVPQALRFLFIPREAYWSLIYLSWVIFKPR